MQKSLLTMALALALPTAYAQSFESRCTALSTWASKISTSAA